MPNKRRNGLGLLLIIMGSLGILFALGDLIVRVLSAIVCFGMVNYGLRMQGMPPLQTSLHHLLARRWF